MKNIYENPTCTLIGLSIADVITTSGNGPEFNWSDGLVRTAADEGTAINDGYGN